MVYFMLFMVVSWLMVSMTLMVIPMCLGRSMFALWDADGHKVYKLYATGLIL